MNDHISSTRATGGAGYEFEYRVGAKYLISLLNGTSPLGIEGIIKTVRFQQNHTGNLLDDIVVITDDNGIEKTLSIQVRLKVTFTESDIEFKELLKKCWKMFAGESDINFNTETDRLGIVVSNFTQNVHDHLLPILEKAKNTHDETSFMSALMHSGNSEQEKKYFSVFKTLLNNFSKQQLSDQQIWKFFKVLKIMGLDLTTDSSESSHQCKIDCEKLVIAGGTPNANSLFDKLTTLAMKYCISGGNANKQSLYNKLKDYKLNEPNNFTFDCNQLRKYANERLNDIHDVIGKADDKISLPRNELVNELKNKLSKTDVLLLSGKSLVGKSTVLKLLVTKLKESGTILGFSTNRMYQADFENFLQNLGVKNDFIEILTVMHSPIYIFIDGLDKIVYDENKKQIVNDLLSKINSYNQIQKDYNNTSNHCKIIATCRKFDEKDIEDILSSYNYEVNNFEIPLLSEKELNYIKTTRSVASELLKMDNSSEILHYPGYLNIFTRYVYLTTTSLPDVITESWCFNAFWSKCVYSSKDRESKIGHGEDREQILKHIAKSSLNSSPPFEDPVRHNVAALDGLLSEGLIIKSDSELIFAHDIFEDYALARVIQDNQNNLENFFSKYVNSRKLLRSFDLFILKILDDKNPDRWYEIFQTLNSSQISPIWQHECLSSIVNSNNLDDNLDLLKNYILKNKGNLLYQLLETLLAQSENSETPSSDKFVKILSFEDQVYLTVPPIDKCESLIQFTTDNLSEIDNKCLSILLKLIYHCIAYLNKSIKINISNLSIKLYEDIVINEYNGVFKFNLSDEIPIEKLLLKIIVWTVDINEKSVIEFIDKYSIERTKNFKPIPNNSKNIIISTQTSAKSKTTYKTHRFDDVIIQGNGWFPLCKFAPEKALHLIKSILCYEPDPKDSYDMIQSNFGIHNFFNFTIPTYLKGPFFGFLNLNEKMGLELIHAVVNHATKIWKSYEPKRKPVPHIVNLTMKPIEVYGDDRVYCWSEYMGNNPVITSALMALEKWMENKIIDGISPKSITEKVMSGTDSVAVIGVCLLILLKYIDKSHDAVLPILENPIFWDMNIKRIANISLEISSIETLSKIFSNNRIDQNAWKTVLDRAKEGHRCLSLSTFVPHILFSDNQRNRNAMIKKLELFPTKVPYYYEDELNDQNTMKTRKERCEMWAKLANKENYSKKLIDGKVMIELDPNTTYTDKQKQQNTDFGKVGDWVKFYGWSIEFIDGKKTLDKSMIKSAIEYIDKFDHKLLNTQPILTKKTFRESITNFIGGLIIYHWTVVIELNQQQWCLDHFNYILHLNYHDENVVQIFPYGIDRAVAKTLPTLFLNSQVHSKYLRFFKKNKYEKDIIEYALVNNNEVRRFLFIALRKLWNNDDKLIFKCIEQTLNFSVEKDPNGESYFNEQKLITIMYVFDYLPKIENSHTIDRIQKIFSNLLDFTIKSYQHEREEERYEWEVINFDWNRKFFSTFSQFILKFEQHRSSLLIKIDDKWNNTPALMEQFLRYLLYVGTDPKFKDAFIELWTSYTNIILDSLKDNNFDYKFNDEINNIKSLLIFLDPLKIISLGENTTSLLSEIIPCIEKWCDMFDNNIECLENLMNMLNTIGFNLMINFGIKWLDRFINNIKKDVFIEKQLPEKLARLLWRTLDNYESDVQQNPHTYDQLVKITDFLVSTNDRLAPKIKDKLQKIHENEKIR